MTNINTKSNNNYSTFPSIARVAEGHLITFRVAGVESLNASINDLTTHHDPDSQIVIMESFDNGLNWHNDTYRCILKRIY